VAAQPDPLGLVGWDMEAEAVTWTTLGPNITPLEAVLALNATVVALVFVTLVESVLSRRRAGEEPEEEGEGEED